MAMERAAMAAGTVTKIERLSLMESLPRRLFCATDYDRADGGCAAAYAKHEPDISGGDPFRAPGSGGWVATLSQERRG
jgi:hypothetical protein